MDISGESQEYVWIGAVCSVLIIIEQIIIIVRISINWEFPSHILSLFGLHLFSYDDVLIFVEFTSKTW